MSSLGTLSLDFLVKLNNSMQQIQNLEGKINGLEQKAQKTQQQLDKLNNVKLGNMANQFDSARGSIDKFKGSLGSVVSGKGGMGDLVGAFKGIPPQALIAAGGVAAVSAAVIGLGVAIQQSLSFTQSYGDEMAKNSQKAGVAVEAYQEMRHAADMSGVSAGELDKTFKHINKTLGDSENAKNKSVQGFKALGISLKDTNGNLKSADQILQETAGAFEGIASDTDKAALALELFGKDGAALMPMLNAGEEGIKAMREEANRLGIVMGDEATKQAEAYGDSMARLGKFFDGLKMTIGTAFMPAAQMVLDVMLEMGLAFKAALPSGTNVKDLILNIAKNALRSFVSIAQSAVEKIINFGKVLRAAAPLLSVWITHLQNVFNALNGVINVLEIFRGVVQGSILFVLSAFAQGLSSVLSGLQGLASFAGLEGLASKLGSFKDAALAGANALGELSKQSFKSAAGDLEDARASFGKLTSDALQYSDTIKGWGTNIEEFGNKAKNALQPVNGIIDAFGKGGEIKLQPSDETQRTLKDIHNAVVDGNEEAKKNRAKDTAKNIEKLSTPALFEKLTGGKFPENLAQDKASIQATEQFNKRRIEAENKLLERQKKIDASLSSYNNSIKQIDGKTQEQIATVEKANKSSEKAAISKSLAANQSFLAQQAAKDNAYYEREIAKINAEKELLAAEIRNKYKDAAIQAGVAIAVGVQTGARTGGPKAAIGGGVIGGGLAVGGLGRAIKDVLEINDKMDELNNKEKQYNELIKKNNKAIAQGEIALESTVKYTNESASASQDKYDAEVKLTELAKEKQGLESKSVATSVSRAKAQAEYAASVVAINAEQMAFEISLGKASQEKERRDNAINEILRLRTQIAQNEIDLGEEAARFANAKLQNEIKNLEISLQDVTEAERKVLLLEQQANHQGRINGMLNEAVNKARESAEQARAAAESLAAREETAKRGLTLLREEKEINKQMLELSFRLQDIENSNMTRLEKELEMRRAILDAEKKITEEKAKQWEKAGQIATGAGGLFSDLGSLIKKIDPNASDETIRQLNNVSGALNGAGESLSGVARMMMGDITGIFSVISGLMGTIGSVYDFFFGETEDEKKAREEKEKKDEEARFDDINQIFFDNAALRQQAEEFAKAFVSEQERRMGRPVEITIDARGALIGEENEVARALGNLLETELGRRVGNVGLPGR